MKSSGEASVWLWAPAILTSLCLQGRVLGLGVRAFPHFGPQAHPLHVSTVATMRGCVVPT